MSAPSDTSRPVRVANRSERNVGLDVWLVEHHNPFAGMVLDLAAMGAGERIGTHPRGFVRLPWRKQLPVSIVGQVRSLTGSELLQNTFEFVQRHRTNPLIRPPRARPVANSAGAYVARMEDVLVEHRISRRTRSEPDPSLQSACQI